MDFTGTAQMIITGELSWEKKYCQEQLLAMSIDTNLTDFQAWN